MSGDQIPKIGEHRGVGLDDCQSEERLVVVRRAIDDVFAMSDDYRDLLRVARTPIWPPEARRLAAAMLEAKMAIATDRREIRPDYDLDYVRASVAGLDSAKWRDRRYFCSLFDVAHGSPGTPHAVLRETPLTDD